MQTISPQPFSFCTSKFPGLNFFYVVNLNLLKGRSERHTKCQKAKIISDFCKASSNLSPSVILFHDFRPLIQKIAIAH